MANVEELASLITALAAVLAVFIAAVNLRSISQAYKFQALQSFLRTWEQSEDDRQWVRDRFTKLPDCGLKNEEEKRVRRVINTLNITYLQIERRLLDAGLVFDLCHVEIIRLSHRVRPFIAKERSFGWPHYGSRIAKLDSKAKRFSIANRHKSSAVIAVRADDKEIEPSKVVYRPCLPSGLLGIYYRINLVIRRKFGLY